ncbi:MAG: Tetratricopeptide 2 repeat protein [Anaeromyxobacteraceae bacterium]|nr:Tetratricopeptide 2 repeat protein [Anaeromyxobacteraceae bacterium]
MLLLGALAYSSSLRGEFAFDDLPQIVQNLAIRDLGSFVGPGSRGILPNRYVAYLTFAMSYQAGGLDPFGWHLANLAIHLASAVLVWTLVLLAFRTPRLRSSKLAPSSGAIAFAAAALFVAHPLATQAVSYVVQRITSLTTLFYLLAVVLYTAWRLSTGTGARIAAYVGVLVAALLAFRSKEIAFTLPAALALVEWAFFEGGWRRWLPLVPVALLSLLIPLTLVDLGKPVSEVLASADSSTRVSTPLAGRHDYLRTQAVVVARYLGLLVLPVGQTVDHDVAIRRSWLAPDVAGSALLLASLALAGAWLAWRSTPRGRRPPLDPAVRLVALGIAWFFVTLSVESSVIPIADVMNEHRVYLPSAGLFPGIATALALLFLRVDPARVARDTAVAAGLAASLLAVVTWNRNRVWRSEVDLWADAAAKSPGHVRALSNLGAALLKQERYAEAAEVFRRDVEAHPGSVASRVQLGVTLYLANRPADAERELRRAVELDPNDPDALLNLSVLLRAVGKAPEARPYLERLRRVAKSADERAWAEARLAE